MLAVGSPERAQFLQWSHFAEPGFCVWAVDYAYHTVLLPEAERDPSIAAHNKAK